MEDKDKKFALWLCVGVGVFIGWLLGINQGKELGRKEEQQFWNTYVPWEIRAWAYSKAGKDADDWRAVAAGDTNRIPEDVKKIFP